MSSSEAIFSTPKPRGQEINPGFYSLIDAKCQSMSFVYYTCRENYKTLTNLLTNCRYGTRKPVTRRRKGKLELGKCGTYNLTKSLLKKGDRAVSDLQFQMQFPV